MQRSQVSASCLVQPPEVNSNLLMKKLRPVLKMTSCCVACGKKILLLKSACVEPLTGVRGKTPVVKGRVGEKPVDILGDTGCSGIVVKRDFVL